MGDNLAYINILINTLKNKSKILDDIMQIIEQQDLLAATQEMDIDAFDELLEEKGELVSALNELDKGFESVFERVREDINKNSSRYKKEIKQLQSLITELTDKTVKIQVAEERNKAKMGLNFARSKKEIKSFKTNNQVSNSYKQNMADRHRGQSYFMDKKK